MLIPIEVEGFEDRRLSIQTAGLLGGAKLLIDGRPSSERPAATSTSCSETTDSKLLLSSIRDCSIQSLA